MSYQRKVEIQSEHEREERRKLRKRQASASGINGLRWARNRKAGLDSGDPVSAPIPKAPPAVGRCGKCGATLWRCGLPKGHVGHCVRREQVDRARFEVESVAIAEKRAEEAKAKTAQDLEPAKNPAVTS